MTLHINLLAPIMLCRLIVSWMAQQRYNKISIYRVAEQQVQGPILVRMVHQKQAWSISARLLPNKLATWV